MAAPRKKAEGTTRKKTTRRKQVEAASRGLAAAELAAEEPPAAVRELARAIEGDGGRALATYRDPLGAHWQIVAALPIDKVRRTAWQRDLSDTHVQRLTAAIGRLDRFLDPLVAVRRDGGYEVPNGGHRLEAMKALGARAVVALVVPEPEIAFEILLLNTEKAHNLRERSLEVIRMARALAEIDDRPEEEYAVVFEEPGFLTLGLCYEENGRFAGGAYNPVLKRVESFLAKPLSKALPERERRRDRLLELDRAVASAVAALKERGFESPYLKAYVIARVNPIRFSKSAAEFDPTIDKMIAAAAKFDAAKVKADQIARTGGPPAED